MALVMKQFLDRFAAMEKVANETLAAKPEALVGVESLPGSEHDAKVPDSAKKPDEEVKDGLPAGAESTTGAVNGGDAKPLNEGKLEMDQALLNPEKKPLISDDALTAKVASDQLIPIVKDLLADLKGTQKQASAKPAEVPAKTEEKKTEEKKAEDTKKPDEKKPEEKKEEKSAAIHLDDETISKLAAAHATFMLGHEAAQKVVKQASVNKAEAISLIKAACIKAAQEQGLDPAAAAAAADNAMAAAGMTPAETAAADAGAAETAAAEAGADAGAAETAAKDATLPEDVTEEELGNAIIDLVQSGELDPDTAKALVEEIAGEGDGVPSEDQAAEIIAQGLESGKITPEQAQEIATAIEAGDAGAAETAAADAGAADAEAQGAADAAAAIQDAQDEAQGAADAEAAMKSAAAKIRSDAISKIASAIVAKREMAKKASAQPGSKIMAKVASILQTKVDQSKAKQEPEKQASDAKYIEGFKKKAEEMGVDPKVLAQYVIANKAK